MRRMAMHELVHGDVYEIRSRNLMVGVWDEQAHGFTGLRYKFGELYLFTEYHWAYDPHIGTVSQMEPLRITLPTGMETVPGWSVCGHCEEPVVWVEAEPGELPRGVWQHEELGKDHEAKAYRLMNQPLFDFLLPIQKKLMGKDTD